MLWLLALVLPSYLILVRTLRYRRVTSIATRFSEDEIRNMTPYIAQKIVHDSFLYDTPMTMLLGTQIALFKVYGISSIATILLKTGILTSAQINKRLADTAVLISTALSNPIGGPGSGCPFIYSSLDPRGAIAIARMNYLHKKYPIHNDDFLYNLSLFMIEPIEKTAQFGWRSHSLVEIHAIFVLWTEIGRRMGIQDIWDSYDQMVEWSRQYEIDNMVPTEASRELASITLAHFRERVPNVLGLRAAVYQVALAVLDRRTRMAMGLPDPSPFSVMAVHKLFRLRAALVRYFCLPRGKPSLWVRLDSHHIVDEAGVPRIPAVYCRRSGPWYYPEAVGWALIKQQVKVMLRLQDADKVPSRRWKSEGYRLEEIGPERFTMQGHEEVMREAARIQGCHIDGPWGTSPSSA